jgi:hypothetical protein
VDFFLLAVLIVPPLVGRGITRLRTEIAEVAEPARATLQPTEGKAAQERADLLALLEPLPRAARAEIVQIWDEYEAASTTEARVAKALDKLETITQHTRNRNPSSFDYPFHPGYGSQDTVVHPLIVEYAAFWTRRRHRWLERRGSAELQCPWNGELNASAGATARCFCQRLIGAASPAR